jgi:hypothetical protein
MARNQDDELTQDAIEHLKELMGDASVNDLVDDLGITGPLDADGGFPPKKFRKNKKHDRP